MLAVSIAAVWEAARAIGKLNVKCTTAIIYIYAAAMAAIAFFGLEDYTELVTFLAVFAIMLAAVIMPEVRGKGAVASLGLLLYPMFPFVILMKLALADCWVPVFVLGCVSTWVCDSFAMFGGKWFGKHKLITAVSPNKTVEGTATGAAASVIAGVIVYFALKSSFDISLVCCMVTALIASSFGQIGDLAASLIKRMAGIKDYSNLIPGHGGALDRTDSLLFAIPCTYFCLMIFGVI